MTVQEQYNQINSAIDAIENGAQEYQIGSRRVVKASLATLYKERQRLSGQLESENNNGGMYVAQFDRR